jgi:uncharacterized YigZ family protein
MTDTYKTIQNISEGSYKDKGSKFIAIAFPVESEEEVKHHQGEIRKQFHDARHHCYAYAIGQNHEQYRINDDGEPSGTAGKPIYGQIQSFELTNILIIVVRYFGGTKLGVRGLINAYKGAAKDALDNNVIIEKYLYNKYKLDFEYLEMNNVMRIIKEMNLSQSNHNFKEKCTLEFAVRQSFANEAMNAFSSLNNVIVTKLS